MKAKLSKWLRSPSGTVTSILALVCVIMMLIDCLVFKTKPHSYLSGSITEIIGIIITVIFVQMLFDRNNEVNQRIDEKKKILRANKSISLLIDRYELFLFCMTNNNSKLEGGKPSLDNDYSIADLAHCHQQCLLMDYSHYDSCVSLFFRNERELRDVFISLTQNIDLNYHPEMSALILRYIETSFDYDSSNAIIANEQLYTNPNTPEQQPSILLISEALEKSGQEYLDGLTHGRSKVSNAMYPYTRLFGLTQIQRKLLIEYRDCIRQIKDLNDLDTPSQKGNA